MTYLDWVAVQNAERRNRAARAANAGQSPFNLGAAQFGVGQHVGHISGIPTYNGTIVSMRFVPGRGWGYTLSNGFEIFEEALAPLDRTSPRGRASGADAEIERLKEQIADLTRRLEDAQRRGQADAGAAQLERERLRSQHQLGLLDTLGRLAPLARTPQGFQSLSAFLREQGLMTQGLAGFLAELQAVPLPPSPFTAPRPGVHFEQGFPR